MQAFSQNDTITLSYPYYYPEIVVPEFETYPISENPFANTLTCFPFRLGAYMFGFINDYQYVGYQYVTERSLTVVGMAGALAAWFPRDTYYDLQDFQYQNCRIGLAHALGDSVSIFASVPLYPSLENISKRMMIEFPQQDTTAETWIFESYLSTPITIEAGDTFYFSITGITSSSGDALAENLMTQIRECHTPQDMSTMHWQKNKFRVRDFHTGEWKDIEHTDIPLVWLIIRRDEDTCPVPQPYAEKMSDNAVFVRWDNNANHAAAEFSFGPAGIAPEDVTVYQSPIPQHVFGGLDPDSHYTVYARARCDFAQSEWTDWSAPLDIHLASMSGIDGAAPSPTLTLAPNPAADEARIACSHTMQSVTLFAADGTAMLTLHPDATEAAIDLRRLPRGTYTAVAETAAGTASRPLVVQ